MALFRVMIKQSSTFNGTRVEKGMSVDVPTISNISPVSADGGKLVQDAFIRIYGIDLKSLNMLNHSWLDAKQI